MVDEGSIIRYTSFQLHLTHPYELNSGVTQTLLLMTDNSLGGERERLKVINTNSKHNRYLNIVWDPKTEKIFIPTCVVNSSPELRTCEL